MNRIYIILRISGIQRRISSSLMMLLVTRLDVDNKQHRSTYYIQSTTAEVDQTAVRRVISDRVAFPDLCVAYTR